MVLGRDALSGGQQPRPLFSPCGHEKAIATWPDRARGQDLGLVGFGRTPDHCARGRTAPAEHQTARAMRAGW